MSNSNTNLILLQQEIGPMQNFIYFIGNQKTKEVVVVDPAWDVPYIQDFVKKQQWKLKGILVTHVHFDHTNGIEPLLKDYDIPVYVSKKEVEFYKMVYNNIKSVDTNFELTLGDEVKIRFLHTPGHTPGSQCFYVNNQFLVSGDTLFLDGCGRCDLPGGDAEQMFDTISSKLMQLPNDTVIYPGHNYHHHLTSDSLEQQKKTNPYMTSENLHHFIDKRLK